MMCLSIWLRIFIGGVYEEFKSSQAKGDTLGIRDPAEKAWNAVVQAINALILKRVGKLPSSYFEGGEFLGRLRLRIARFQS